jgi:hypothetical protein
VSAPTTRPVTSSGWYEETDGTIAEYKWCAGRLVRGRTAPSWAEVPESPSWEAPIAGAEVVEP